MRDYRPRMARVEYAYRKSASCRFAGDHRLGRFFMFKQAAVGLMGLCVMSSPAFANCSEHEMASFQAALSNVQAVAMGLLTGQATFDDAQRASATYQRRVSELSPACQQYIAKVSLSAPPPGSSSRPPYAKPGPGVGLPGCVGGICSTPDGTYKVIPR